MAYDEDHILFLDQSRKIAHRTYENARRDACDGVALDIRGCKYTGLMLDISSGIIGLLQP